MNTLNKIIHEFQFGHLEKPVKEHLQNVYGAMSLCFMVCCLGVYVEMYTEFLAAGLMTSLVSLGMLMYLLHLTPTPENHTTRFGLLNGVAFFTGVSLGPLINYVVDIDPSILTTAILSTFLVFVCFSLSALLAKDRKFLTLGGILLTGMTSLLVLGLLNIFIGSTLLYRAELYIGLALMCGFVLFNTQSIIEKRRQGDTDVIRHCLDLFLDLVNMFRYILLLLTDKENRNRRRRNNRND